jgi:hypothetical protein
MKKRLRGEAAERLTEELQTCGKEIYAGTGVLIGTALPSSKLYPDGLVSRRKAGMKKKSDLDAIDPYLMIGIEGMLLCEYSEEQILSHFQQILKKDYPQKGRKALLADLRKASRIREATPPEEWPALFLDILRASGWFPAAVREIIDQIEKLPANASKAEVARIVSAARNKMKARKVKQTT